MQALSAKKFYPVIHCIDPFRQNGIMHAIQNMHIAVENGADGVFLIGHHLQFSQLTRIYDDARSEFPRFWIGINFLDLGSKKNWIGLETVVAGCPNLDSLWIDQMPSYRLSLPPRVQVFGGVAFKYIAPNLSDEGLTEACVEAERCVHVATTSGEATGIPPSIQKLVSIRKALRGRIPLAVASGVDEQNASSLFPYTDAFLVSSSICERKPLGNITADYFIAKKVQTLADAIHKSED